MLLQLFWTFFKIGLFTIGGGYAMLPIIQEKVCAVHHWLTDEEFLDSISLTNSLPGPLATNAATFIGYKIKGFPGALASVLGTISPSIIIILLIAMVFNNLMSYPAVNYFFMGVRPAVFALMCSSVYKLAKSTKINETYNLIVAGVSFALIGFLKITSIYVVIGAALVAILTGSFAGKEEQHE